MPRALIVGAGIGGLSAAVALRRAGWAVRVFERAASPRELGFALNLAPNALAALAELGLADRIRAAGSELRRVEIHSGTGRLLRQLTLPPVARPHLPGVMALRPVIHGALLEAVATDPSALVLGATARGYVASPSGVEVDLADGRRESGDVLVGADGVGSRLRAQLHPDEPPPRPSGYSAVRGASFAGGVHLHGLDALVHLGRGIESAAVRAGGDAVYWYLSMLAADVAGGGADLLELAARQTRGFDPRLQALLRATDEIRLDDLLVRDALPAWGRGRITLLGDAAHPMLPHAGQGAAQAIEDAVALGLALTDANDVETGLRRYEQVRSARTRSFVALSRRLAHVTTTRSRIVCVLRDTAVRLVPARLIAGTMQPRNHRDPHAALRPADHFGAR